MADQRHTTAQTVGIWIVAGVAACVALYFGREFFLPIVFAFLLNAVFRPVVRGLEALRVPTSLASAIVVLAATGLMTAAGVALAEPIKNWVEQAPKRFEAAQEKFERVRKPFKQVSDT